MSAALPETVLQFGAGRFLRAFADAFIQDANEAGQAIGRVVVVQSTPGSRADLLNRRPDGYHVLIRGLEGGQVVERVEHVRSISRALSALTQCEDVLEVARAPALRLLISNTTEAGYATDPADQLTDRPPRSFPARLTQVLWHRYEHGQRPLTIVPCELLERNAKKLRELVVQQLEAWGLPDAFEDWLARQCLWLNNLVDRIVVLPPADHPLAAQDPLLVQTEPFALWAMERPAVDCQPPFMHPAVEMVQDLTPYYLRKVRILNGIHSALVAKCLPRGFTTVQQALNDPAVMDWVLGLLYEEIVPTLAYRVDNVARFARQTLERFNNPFLEHRLSDIAVNNRDKVKIRLQPTAAEYELLFGKKPTRIMEVLAYHP